MVLPTATGMTPNRGSGWQMMWQGRSWWRWQKLLHRGQGNRRTNSVTGIRVTMVTGGQMLWQGDQGDKLCHTGLRVTTAFTGCQGWITRLPHHKLECYCHQQVHVHKTTLPHVSLENHAFFLIISVPCWSVPYSTGTVTCVWTNSSLCPKNEIIGLYNCVCVCGGGNIPV